MSEKEQMLRDIGIVGFVINDLTIFLDTHPYDKMALDYFNHYNRIKQHMEQEFARKYYPLTTDYCEGSTSWKWGNDYSGIDSLPWENDCNC